MGKRAWKSNSGNMELAVTMVKGVWLVMETGAWPVMTQGEVCLVTMEKGVWPVATHVKTIGEAPLKVKSMVPLLKGRGGVVGSTMPNPTAARRIGGGA